MHPQIEPLRAAVGRLPRGLAEHIEGVVVEARRLALLLAAALLAGTASLIAFSFRQQE